MIALIIALLLHGEVATAGGDNPFIDKYLASARSLVEADDLPAARAAVERALERDDQHLNALELLVAVCVAQNDLDAATWALHRWVTVVDAANKSPVSRTNRKQVVEQLLLLDPRAEEFQQLTATYIDGLLKLAKEHRKRGRLHSALELYQEALTVDPLNHEARAAIRSVRRSGGKDVAVEDIFGGTGDPTAGIDAETISELEAEHSTWETAFTSETENYRYRTDASYLVYKTAPIAMEQMNQAYRKFFHYKEDGDPTPKIDVLIYKNRDEYLEENGLRENDWSGGFFNGSSVQTFIGGTTGKESIRQMYGTLFHEAAHQFVSLTGKGGVPGWLNEAYASFFEGTTMLSNGSVRWNQVPNHRLFPLAERMDRGWMGSGRDASADAEGNWSTPEGAPTFRIVVTGDYQWGPPWYAPTWGVVYFLYNFRDRKTGEPVFRKSLHDYYLSNAAGRSKPVEHFEELVLKGAKLSPVSDIDGLNELWKDWILELRDVQRGKRQSGKSKLEYGDLAAQRGESEQAVSFYEEAYLHMSEDPEVIWKLAEALEDNKELDRALALYLQFARELELRGLSREDSRYPLALEKVRKLDPLFRRHDKLKLEVQTAGMELARSYRERKMPLMALEITRRMSANFSMPEALELYTEVARETGKSLARWRVVYNEFDLSGWSGDDGYRAYGKMIEANVVDNPTISTVEGQFQTQQLNCDVTFDADFSLEADVRFNLDSSLVGLCFGRKDSQNFNAVLLHPKGYLDISTQHGGSWTVRDHRAVEIDLSWQRLRIDVVGKVLDVYLNGQYIRSLSMPSRESVRGGFGLICGTGKAYFQDIRLLARDPHDPAARIERELAMEKVANNEIERPSGTFSGIVPPTLQLGELLQGEAFSLEALRGRPAALIFWAPYQDKVIPTTAYYAWLAKQWSELGVRMVAVTSSQHSPEEVRDYLLEHPMPGVSLAMDSFFRTYKDYNLSTTGYGLPRILLLDVDGKVTWEGDPGLLRGRGWAEGDGQTFFDGAISNLVETRMLREVVEAMPTLAAAEASLKTGNFRQAIGFCAKLADLDASWASEVQKARTLRTRIEAIGAALPIRARQAEVSGYPLDAQALLELGVNQFSNTPIGVLCAERLKTLSKSKVLREARSAWKQLEKAATEASRGREASRIIPYLDRAIARNQCAQVTAAHTAMLEALLDYGTEALAESWQRLQPTAEIETE